MRMGGVTCLSRAGCRSDRLRRCVDLTSLTCKRRDQNLQLPEEDSTGESPTDTSESTSDGDENGKFNYGYDSMRLIHRSHYVLLSH